MKAFLIGMGAFLAIIALTGLTIFSTVKGTYNKLVNERTAVERLASDVDVQMQRRADLVPNLVQTTKGAMAQEQAVFENISKAHAAFSNAPQGSSERFEAGTALGTALRGYMVVAQQYPQLASLDIIKDLNTNLDGTENRISVARQRYNEETQKYNSHLQEFPTNMIAGYFNFEKKPFFEIAQEAKEVPKVDLTLE